MVNEFLSFRSFCFIVLLLNLNLPSFAGQFIQTPVSQQPNSNLNISGNGIVGRTLSVGNAGTSARLPGLLISLSEPPRLGRPIGLQHLQLRFVNQRAHDSKIKRQCRNRGGHSDRASFGQPKFRLYLNRAAAATSNSAAVKEQQAQIESQRNQIDAQNSIIDAQRREIDALRKAVCEINPRAAVCKHQEAHDEKTRE